MWAILKLLPLYREAPDQDLLFGHPRLQGQIGGRLLRKDDAERAQIVDDIARVAAAAHLLLRLLQMVTDLFIGGRVPLADEDQFGGHLAVAALAKPEPASPPSEMENAVV